MRRALLASIVLLGCSGDDTPPCAPPPTPAAEPFVDATTELGVDVQHHFQTDLCAITDTTGGAGVCMLDHDGDGDLDLYFADRAPFPNRLLRNDGGSFSDVTDASGAGVTTDTMGCLALDYDGDGDLDLYLTNVGSDQLLRNDGGTFTDVSSSMGIDTVASFTVTASAGDIDEDGDLDIIVGGMVKPETCPQEICSPYPGACQAERSLLWVNEGDHFEEQAEERGITDLGPTLATLMMDMDVDGDIDIYIGNDIGLEFPDRMYLNDGQGFFEDNALDMGLEGVGTDTMGIDIGDFNFDGYLDVLTSDFKGRPLRLFRCSDPAFLCSFESLPDSTNYVKWSSVFADFDHDVDLDAFSTTGDVSTIEGPAESRNYLYFNNGGNFSEYVPLAGDAMAQEAISRGAAYGDLDGDGDLDIVVGNGNGQAQVLINEGAAGHSLTLTLDTRAAGARVQVSTPTSSLTEQVLIGNGYSSSSDPRLHFGLGEACRADVTVTYLDGSSTTLTDVPAGFAAVPR